MARPQDELRTPIREPVRQDYSNMTEAEIDALVSQEESADRLHIPQSLIPDGMTYQWVRNEVYGKPDPANIARMEQRGWKSVPHSRHPGVWAQAGTEGPVMLDGLMLMELPTPLYEGKQRHATRQARNTVRDLEAQMIYSPPGQAPRDAHQKTMPRINRSYERPMEVE